MSNLIKNTMDEQGFKDALLEVRSNLSGLGLRTFPKPDISPIPFTPLEMPQTNSGKPLDNRYKTITKDDITKAERSPIGDLSLTGFTYGYYFRTVPESVKNLWFGFIRDKEHSGLYLRAMPNSENSTRRLMHEGYKYNTLWSPQFWLVKRFISNKGMEKLLRLSDKDKKQYLKIIIENTYPF